MGLGYFVIADKEFRSSIEGVSFRNGKSKNLYDDAIGKKKWLVELLKSKHNADFFLVDDNGKMVNSKDNVKKVEGTKIESQKVENFIWNRKAKEVENKKIEEEKKAKVEEVKKKNDSFIWDRKKNEIEMKMKKIEQDKKDKLNVETKVEVKKVENKKEVTTKVKSNTNKNTNKSNVGKKRSGRTVVKKSNVNKKSDNPFLNKVNKK